MKKGMKIVMILFSIFLSIVTQAQSIDGVIQGLKSGDAVKVMDNASDNVLLTLYDKSNTYSKAQAQQIVRDFFAKVSVKTFEMKHKGDSPNGNYCIGTLITANGNFRVNVFMRNDGKNEFIRELRFQLIE